MSALTILLIALAISDMLAPQANALIAFSHYHLSNKFSDSVSYLKFDDFLRFIIHPLSTMFTMSSSWIVTLATFFRLIAVIWPFKARTLINKRFAMLSVLIIFGFSTIFIIPIYSSLEKTVKCTRDSKTQYETLGIVIKSGILSKAYMPTMQIMCFYLPWLIALILWLFLLRSLRKSEKNFNFTFYSSKESSSINQSINNSIYNIIEKSMIVKQESFINTNFNEGCSKYNLNGSIRVSKSGCMNQNTDSRMNNAQTRLRSYNKITLMVVVLCFTNLICRVFTFVFIFESIFNEYISRNLTHLINEPLLNNSSVISNEFIYEDAKIKFPKFLAYSLLLNNIFLCINHCCNIFIYTLTNPRFKRNLIIMIKRNKIFRHFQKNLDQQNHEYINHESERNFHENNTKKSIKKYKCFGFLSTNTKHDDIRLTSIEKRKVAKKSWK